jgi:hypothetical protein
MSGGLIHENELAARGLDPEFVCPSRSLGQIGSAHESSFCALHATGTPPPKTLAISLAVAALVALVIVLAASANGSGGGLY